MWLKEKQRPLAPDQNQQNLILQRLGQKKLMMCHKNALSFLKCRLQFQPGGVMRLPEKKQLNQ